MDPDLDQQLATWMRNAQDGDRNAYESLLAEVAILLRAFIRQRVKQVEWVDDVVQEVLISIHRDRHTYDPRRSFSPWMYAIARHRLIDFARKQRRRLEQEQLQDGAPEPASAVVNPEFDVNPFERLRRALMRLSRKQREVIQMLKLDGFTIREISTKTGMSESSIKVNAHRGYKNLRKLIESGSDDDR